jgi:mercuric reductase
MEMASIQVELKRLQESAGHDVLQSVERLRQLLPLEKRQRALAPPVRTIHREILKSLATSGKPLRQSQIAAMLGSKQSALHVLAVLAGNDLVVLSNPAKRDANTKQLAVPENTEVVGAYPMTTAETPHRVVLGRTAVNAMCAVDALAISPMFGTGTTIESKCHVTGTPIRILQKGTSFAEVRPSPEIRVGIRWQTFTSCAAHTLCMEMVFLKDEETANRWRETDAASIEILTLPEALELGMAFFLPLLEE